MAKTHILGFADFLPVAAGLVVFVAGLGVAWWVRRLAAG